MSALCAWCKSTVGSIRRYGQRSNPSPAKIGCLPQTLLEWGKRDETDKDQRDGMNTSDRERLKRLERENKELRRANDILRTASAFFAQAELDRPPRS